MQSGDLYEACFDDDGVNSRGVVGEGGVCEEQRGVAWCDQWYLRGGASD